MPATLKAPPDRANGPPWRLMRRPGARFTTAIATLQCDMLQVRSLDALPGMADA